MQERKILNTMVDGRDEDPGVGLVLVFLFYMWYSNDLGYIAAHETTVMERRSFTRRNNESFISLFRKSRTELK